MRPPLPDAVRNKARVHGAEAWLDALPQLVSEIEAEWGLTVGRTFESATEAFVAEATCADGTPAVLKLVVPREAHAAEHEIAALRLAGGEGCAELLRADPRRGALLLERLGAGMFELSLSPDERRTLLAAAAARVWRPVPGAELPSGAAKAAWLAEFVPRTWEETGRPCGERAVAHAVACAERRRAAHDDTRALLVHGDVHQWNALRAPDGSFRLVDPDGLIAEPELDLGILMREDPLELMTGDPRDRARRLAALTGLDAEAIHEWGVAERVSTGLLLARIGLQPVARQMLAAADRVAGCERGGPQAQSKRSPSSS